MLVDFGQAIAEPSSVPQRITVSSRLGYARVSTYGQTLDAQLDQLRAAGCSSRNIYREKVTGARADRRELLRMLKDLAPGDVVTVTRIDRLARSTFDLFAIVKRIVDAGDAIQSSAATGTAHTVDVAASTGFVKPTENFVSGNRPPPMRRRYGTRAAAGNRAIQATEQQPFTTLKF